MNVKDNSSKGAAAGGLSGLEAVVAEAKLQGKSRGYPPVERWNPPYCGEIGLKIAADGTWFYQGSPIGRKPLVKLFASVLRKDDDGRHYLVTPAEKVGIDVADAPFLAVEMAVEGEGREQVITFRTNVDDIVQAGPEHPIHFRQAAADHGMKPYIHVRGRLEALATRALYYDLVGLAVCEMGDDGERFGLWSGGAFFVMSENADEFSREAE